MDVATGGHDKGHESGYAPSTTGFVSMKLWATPPAANFPLQAPQLLLQPGTNGPAAVGAAAKTSELEDSRSVFMLRNGGRGVSAATGAVAGGGGGDGGHRRKVRVSVTGTVNGQAVSTECTIDPSHPLADVTKDIAMSLGVGRQWSNYCLRHGESDTLLSDKTLRKLVKDGDVLKFSTSPAQLARLDVKDLESEDELVVKRAAFILQKHMKEEEFVDEFLALRGLERLQDMLAAIFVKQNLVNICRPVTAILIKLVSSDPTAENSPIQCYGFDVVSNALSSQSSFLPTLVQRLLATDYILQLNSLHLVNILFRKATDRYRGEFVYQLDSLKIRQVVLSLMRTQPPEDLGKQLVEFQRLLIQEGHRRKRLPVDTRNPEHEAMLNDIWAASALSPIPEEGFKWRQIGFEFEEVFALTVKFYFAMWEEMDAQTVLEDINRVASVVRSQFRYVNGIVNPTDANMLATFERALFSLSYEAIRERQLRELENDDMHLSREPSYEFIRNQRVECLIRGAWFPVVREKGRVKGVYRFYRLGPNKKFLHFGDFLEMSERKPALEELGNKIDMALVTDILTGPSSPVFKSKKNMASETLSLCFSLVTSYTDTNESQSLADFVCSNPTQFVEWKDGFNMLLDKSIDTEATGALLTELTEIEVKLALLDLTGDGVEIPNAAPDVPDLPASWAFVYDEEGGKEGIGGLASLAGTMMQSLARPNAGGTEADEAGMANGVEPAESGGDGGGEGGEAEEEEDGDDDDGEELPFAANEQVAQLDPGLPLLLDQMPHLIVVGGTEHGIVGLGEDPAPQLSRKRIDAVQANLQNLTGLRFQALGR
ncbi:hypothetical protein HK405_004832 [Cladochytrium tenue]|nr:hypothetical protein HK405_004832 [Cladochytrium tenue]